MIQIIAGEKGEGKTKRLISMANEAAKNSKGHVVFVDDDDTHMYDLHYNIRFVKANLAIDDQKIFFGFLCGILSQDSDIENIFIDGLHNIVKNLSNDDISEFVSEVEQISKENEVDFTFIISAKVDSLPEAAKKYVI
ncbi:MAG: twitching motility protein PilT [Clostridia bacterium]|jgi:hypothetical protein|nr:twitching motility protein PilT [Clostridia bacterium]MCI1959302.1 twitching motility protein PilT [Clostridia bacterium]MCI1999615.1 twitching motility protein PilT [Clostridia bacterium]MCI2014006.1 twitching motility protein PilT [Clostridia bacterium]